jgi:hypothetical protein
MPGRNPLRDPSEVRFRARRLGEEQILVLERSAEDSSRVALQGRRSSSRGRDDLASLELRTRSRQRGVAAHAAASLAFSGRETTNQSQE